MKEHFETIETLLAQAKEHDSGGRKKVAEQLLRAVFVFLPLSSRAALAADADKAS